MSVHDIKLVVYERPPGIEDVTPPPDESYIVSTEDGNFMKLNVGWVRETDDKDGKIVTKFWKTGRLPNGVALNYEYVGDRRFK